MFTYIVRLGGMSGIVCGVAHMWSVAYIGWHGSC